MLYKYLAFFPLLICLCTTSQLIPEEVESLKQIAKILGKTDWDFSVDPCSGLSNWLNTKPVKGFENGVRCNCSSSSSLNNTVCRVISIVLKSQNLPGTLPKELNLPFLQELDLTRNYLNGTIPAEWGSSQLVNISLNVNRLSGPIPKEIGNISTLANLTLEYNQLSGVLPPELGNLSRLERLVLTSNYLTGELPETLAKLSTLKDFRIGDNNFVGSIPDFIQNWPSIQKLVIQGSGLTGPIPRGISFLTNLTDLRISDLGGNDSNFPDISRLGSLKILILRSCNIVGDLPDYLGTLSTLTLKELDLSFNKLSGQIPENFIGQLNSNNIYLTENFLTGQVPDWMLNGGDEIDLSYNNFTVGTNSASCQGRNVNLFSSFSRGNTSGIVSCLSSFRCPKDWHSLYINCGGEAVQTDDTKSYDEDLDAGGPSKFYQSKTNWVSSSTGDFLDDDQPRDTYIWTNSSQISSDSKLYTSARISPLSLTYYGFCLRNGNYTVSLHFAELMFTNDTTYSSLGRRVFDIYIQGKLVRKDFNIEDEAGGVDKPVVIPFTAAVIDSTLEIRFYWAGKGTIGVPAKGVYGPLISAIAVDPNLYVQPVHQNSLSVGSIVGIVIGVVFSISLLLAVLWWKGCLCNKYAIANGNASLNGPRKARLGMSRRA